MTVSKINDIIRNMSERVTSITITPKADSTAEAQCIKLCDDCPRATGLKTVKDDGLKGLFGKKKTISVHGSPMGAEEIGSYVTDKAHGVFFSETSSNNTGVVTGLNDVSVARFVQSIVNCEGPSNEGNDCSALGSRSQSAIEGLDHRMETGTDYFGHKHSFEHVQLVITPSNQS